jgi:1,4-dihydroxy-2-naphthoyl-CoA synthase
MVPLIFFQKFENTDIDNFGEKQQPRKSIHDYHDSMTQMHKRKRKAELEAIQNIHIKLPKCQNVLPPRHQDVQHLDFALTAIDKTLDLDQIREVRGAWNRVLAFCSGENNDERGWSHEFFSCALMGKGILCLGFSWKRPFFRGTHTLY